MKITKDGPLITLQLSRRWSIAIWTRLRFWKLLPRRESAWSGWIRYWRWGPFVVEHDARKNVLRDMIYGAPTRDKPAETGEES